MLDSTTEQDREPDGHFFIARLNARVGPIDRGERYEDPLSEMLKAAALGEVTGGGTLLGEDGEIQYCELEICLDAAASEATLQKICRSLEAQGAAKGSVLLLDDGEREVAFGVNEGLAVYLNGTDLPDSVYEECDINVICDEFEKRLGSNGGIHGDWHGPTESALYLYGPSYDKMVSCIRPFLDSYPLCEKARLEKIA